MIFRKIFYTTLLCFVSQLVIAQIIEVENFTQIFSTPNQENRLPSELNYKNEIQFTTSLLFKAYKKFFSSQDAASCAFEPSCSVFAIEAIQKEGLLKAIPISADRLSRCNKFSPEHYHINPKTGLFIDPVENHLHRQPKK